MAVLAGLDRPKKDRPDKVVGGTGTVNRSDRFKGWFFPWIRQGVVGATSGSRDRSYPEIRIGWVERSDRP